MFIEHQTTPNPHTMKFKPGVILLPSGLIKSYSEEVDCSSSPLAVSLLKIDGVKGVFLTEEFITITKAMEYDWSYLKSIVIAVITDHFLAGLPAFIEEPESINNNNIDNDAITIQIKELIETRVKPAVAQDGGDITFNSFKDGIVYLELHGSCAGCPSSTITLKNGIENMLKHYIPEIKSVESI